MGLVCRLFLYDIVFNVLFVWMVFNFFFKRLYEIFNFFIFLNFVNFFKYICIFDFIYGFYKCKVFMIIYISICILEVILIGLDMVF